MKIPDRAHPLWLAYVLHRVSGLALALFLPVHFWVLSRAVTAPDQLDMFLAIADRSLVKLAEIGLVFLLGAHVLGGLRLMALEWLPWSDRHKTYAAMAVGGAMLVAGAFFISVV